jgi:hypothetical protein
MIAKDNYLAAVTRQQFVNSDRGETFLCCPCQDVISRTVSEEIASQSVSKSVEWSQLTGEWVGGRVGNGDRVPRGRGTPIATRKCSDECDSEETLVCV